MTQQIIAATDGVPGLQFGHWIDGSFQSPQQGAHIESINPVTGDVVSHIAAGTTEDVDLAATAARRAQGGWAATPPADRSRRLADVATAIRDNLTSLAELEISETGKVDSEIGGELESAAAFFDFYASAVRLFRGETIDLGQDRHVFTRHEPFGVVGIITPWNAPLNQAARSIAPAIAVGNAVIVKPSEFTSASTLEFARLATEAGIPAGILNVVTGTGIDAGSPIVRHPYVGRVSFTGSVATGKAVAGLAAERLIPVSLELGGKSPHIIFADANLEAAAEAAATAFTTNAGQICSAGTRLIVQREVHDEIVKRVVNIVRAKAPGTDLGSIITRQQFAKVQEYLAIAESEGATAVTGGRAFPDAETGMYVEPTVYTGVDTTMRIAQEEVFGPVLSVLVFDTEEEAVAIANDSRFGLASGLWTQDIDRVFRVTQQIEAGTVLVNEWGYSVETPFGGYKESGYGREKGSEALHEYTQLKSVLVRLR